MEPKVVKSKELKIHKFGILSVKDYLNSPEIVSMSLALVSMDGINTESCNKDLEALYYILEGAGLFYLNDKVVEVEAGDLVFIPRNTRYHPEGKLKMLSFCSPRWH